MLHQWLYTLKDSHGVFNLFGYITFRAALAGATAFVLSLVFNAWLIRFLKKIKAFEDTRNPDAKPLAELHGCKPLTPTMGGLAILASTGCALLLWGTLANVYVAICVFVAFALGALGFMDDWIKLRAKVTGSGRRGLSKRGKLLGQFAVGLAAGLMLWLHTRDAAFGTRVYLPFFKDASVHLGWGIALWTAFVVALTSNAVNITDGLDGLAAGCSVVTVLALSALAYLVGRADYSRYLQLAYVPGAGEMAVLCAALAGGILGFLWFNCHPAEIFMGDTGALPLGGLIGFIAVAAKYEALLLFIGAVFLAELISVMLQVGSFKTTGKRVFSIAPFHHALEYAGWPETKITVRLWILAAMAAGMALATLKLR